MTLPIVDGRISLRGGSLEDWRTTRLADLASRVGIDVPPLDAIADVPPQPARVNNNQWIVDCPDCNGAEYVWIDGPHLMMCAGCWNARLDHRWRPVALPAEREAIERILRSRPLPGQRNWYPWETLAELADENLGHAGELRPEADQPAGAAS